MLRSSGVVAVNFKNLKLVHYLLTAHPEMNTVVKFGVSLCGCLIGSLVHLVAFFFGSLRGVTEEFSVERDYICSLAQVIENLSVGWVGVFR